MYVCKNDIILYCMVICENGMAIRTRYNTLYKNYDYYSTSYFFSFLLHCVESSHTFPSSSMCTSPVTPEPSPSH